MLGSGLKRVIIWKGKDVENSVTDRIVHLGGGNEKNLLKKGKNLRGCNLSPAIGVAPREAG